jgi:vitamin B12 transporter
MRFSFAGFDRLLSVRELTWRPTCGFAPIAVLGVSLLLAPPVQAQIASLDTVVVTSAREPQRRTDLVADVTVLTRADIEASLADSLESILARVAGVQLSRNGGPGQSASVFLRGAGAQGTVVLIDGVRVGSATLGQADLSAIGLAQVDRIEILRGPASSLYGADAVGGVVQIFTTRASKSPTFYAVAAFGERNASEASFGGSATVGAFALAAGVSREAERGISAIAPNDRYGLYNPDRDGFVRRGAHASMSAEMATGQQISASWNGQRSRAQFDSAQYLPPLFLPDASPDFVNRLGSDALTVSYRGVWTPEWSTRVQLSSQRETLLSGADAPDRYDTQRRQAMAQLAWARSPSEQWVMALESLTESAAATPLGQPVSRRNDAWVLGYTASVQSQHLQADVRSDHNTAYGDNVTGKLGWSWDLAPAWTVRALGGTAFRGPSFNDLVFPGYGVAGIRPERARSVEFGANWRGADAQASLTFYRNRVRDLIGYQPDRTQCPADPAYDFGCAANVARARLQGVSFAASGAWQNIHWRANADWLDARDEGSGEWLPRRARHQENLAIDWVNGPVTSGLAVQSVGRRPESGQWLPAYQTLDLKLLWRFAPQWQVESKLLNATNRSYSAALDSPAPGRQAWVGVRYRMGAEAP